MALTLVVVLLAAGIGALVLRDDSGEPAQPTPDPVPTTVAAAPTVPADPALDSVLKTMRAQISELRGLPWKSEVPVRVVSRDELASRVRNLTNEDFERRRDELVAGETTLKLLGLVADDVNYRRALEDLFSGGVLGFYDDRTKELFVGGEPGPPSAFTRSTIAHELNHALTDQHFGFSARIQALDDEGRTEESVALLALVEGDAETVRLLWEQRHLSAQERATLARGNPEVDLSVYGRTPPYLLASLLFPYETGRSFVEALRRSGGFGAVDAAYGRPPVSTAHVLHPSRYLGGDVPSVPTPPGPPPPGCRALDDGALGEFDMSALLDQEIPTAVAMRAADGWGGDRYSLLRCGSSDALVDRWVARDAADAAELAAALGRWAVSWSGSGVAVGADGSFAGQTGAGRITRTGREIELVVTDDAATAALFPAPAP